MCIRDSFENVHGIDADFFHGIAAFHDEQRGFAERRDALAHGQVIRAVEFELRDRIILEGIDAKGHHAASDLMGGYCYLNNAAIAAQAFLDQGHKKVAILDVDYHHGNGTQSIFYERGDVLFTSVHGHPEAEFPFFLGYEDERGEGAGEGFNFNYPLPAPSPRSSS